MAQRRKVLLITPRFPYPSLSGGEKWAAALARGLAGDYEVSLFSFTNPGMEAHQTALAMSLEGKVFKKVFLCPRFTRGFGELVEKPEDIRPALERAFASGKTACVNVKIDQSVISPGSVALANLGGYKSQ